MDSKESLKVISDFMGYDIPWASLNCIEAVWDKIGYGETQGMNFYRYKSGWQIGIGSAFYNTNVTTRIHLNEAVYVATAKVILELKKEE